jgi:predicted nucleic acid-binding protein
VNILVDTSVWSLSLRREVHPQSTAASKLRFLIDQGERIFLLGIILQEILQGIRVSRLFSKINDTLKAFPLISIEREDFVYAAEAHAICRSKGIQSSTVDALIAAVAINHDLSLLSADNDFHYMAKHIPLKLI